MAPLRPPQRLHAAALLLCTLPLLISAANAPDPAPATSASVASTATRASPLPKSAGSTSLTASPSLPQATHDQRARTRATNPIPSKRGRPKGAAASRRGSSREDDDDDGLMGLGSLPGLGSLRLPGLKVGSMGPMSLLPALLPLGMLPTSLAQLAAAVLAASTLGQFALGRALMQLVRDFVFGPRPGPHIVYKNKGWESHRMPHASGPLLTHVPPDVQMLLHSAAMANLPMKPGTQPLVNYVPSHEVPEPPFLIHEVHRPVAHEFLPHPSGIKLLHHGHPKLPPSFKTPHTFPHHTWQLPPEQSLRAASPTKKPQTEEPSPPRPHDSSEHSSGPVYEFPQDPSPGPLKSAQDQRPRVPLSYANRPVLAPAPVTEQAERRRRPLPQVLSAHLQRHHAELLHLPHPHPVALPASPPEAPQLPDYHLHVVHHGED